MLAVELNLHASPELKTHRIIELNRESVLEDLVLTIYTLEMETWRLSRV